MSVLNSVRISSLVSFQYVKSAFLSEYRGPWPRKIKKIRVKLNELVVNGRFSMLLMVIFL